MRRWSSSGFFCSWGRAPAIRTGRRLCQRRSAGVNAIAAAVCRKGRCRLDGVAEGRLSFFRPSTASWEGLRLVALRSRRGAGRSSARDSEQVGKVVVRGKDYRFKFEALPRGLVTIAALCEAAGRRRVAGQVQVVVGWRSGRARLIGARSTTIPLPVDRARCRRAPRR